MALSTRQPFAEIGSPRLQALSSAKNRQNAIAPTFSSPLGKPTQSTGKRRAASVFEEEDAENVDPSIFNSPTKKSKTGDAYSKPVQFSLCTSPSTSIPSITASPSIPSVRKALASPRPSTSNSTPINLSRGSPKHKRIGLLSKRRTAGSPIRRVDPPSFAHSSPSLPFSIDAALSGTIPNYTPKSALITPAATPSYASTIDESMPKGWLFEIHEDSPEQEAANMMEHSASVLDISSDDDFETKKRNEEMERGKENVPPPDFCPTQPRTQPSADSMDTAEETSVEHVKLPRLRKIAQDAMDEDRLPLGDLPAADFYGEGLDATSYVTVDVTLEKPSSLSKEFDFSTATSEEEIVKEESTDVIAPAEPSEPIVAEEQEQEQHSIQIYSDENVTSDLPITAAEESLVVVEASSEFAESSTLVAS